MTVLQALSAGGGLTARGTDRGMLITRRDASGKPAIFKARPRRRRCRSTMSIYVKESWF